MTELSGVRCIITWQSWPAELAREWLGLELPVTSPAGPPPAPGVQGLLREAAPLLSAAPPRGRVQ